TDARHVRVRRAHRHAITRRQMTGGRSPAQPLHVHEARAARAERRAVRILAELRKWNTQTIDGVQNRGAGRDFYCPIINEEFHAATSAIPSLLVPGERGGAE